MAFEFRDEMIDQHRARGFVVFRGIMPVSLIRDLRRAAVRVPELARKLHGPAAQRLQPIISHLSEPELKPFRDYATLAPLVDAVQRVLSPRHELSHGLDRTGLLIEPSDVPGCTAWHRDARETSNVPDIEEFRRVACNPLWFNQINCPLYEDNCTWFVPGSQLRQFDFEEETRAAAATEGLAETTDYAERERIHLEYCKRMPGALRASMDAGDFMLYHPLGWHLGNYLPDRKRVTIHDWVPMPEVVDWNTRWEQSRAKKSA